MVTSSMPRWDLDVIFPSLDSAEFKAAFASIKSDTTEIGARMDVLGIEKGTKNDNPGPAFEETLTLINGLMDKVRVLTAFLHALTTTNTRDTAAQAMQSEMDVQSVEIRKLQKRLTGWIGSQSLDALKATELGEQNLYALDKAVIAAERQMDPERETLAGDLGVTGGGAWGKLYSNVTSQILVDIDGESHPISAVRAMAYDSDRAVRKKAYKAEIEAWKANATPITAAINSIKGESLTLGRYRGWASPLDESLFSSNIDRETLEAMMTAAEESFPVFRRYLKAKAKHLGVAQLGFYDLFAPLTGEGRAWEYDQACEFVTEQFGVYSPKMADFAARAFKEDWIDAPPAAGKVDGAYCMGVRKDESRILMNFKPAFGSVSTLAHELGHGYHNLCMADKTWSQKSTPMTLAETASIFCETIIRQGVLENGSPEDQKTVLEASLQGSCQVVVDISSRYFFESAVFAKRAERELSEAELCEAMLDAQRRTYGDGLAADEMHPYMWAAKPHYYGRGFYNYPYMFGLLFGLGLYAVYKAEPAGFVERYDELLSNTGMADAATLGQSFGIDIRSTDFWRASLKQIEADVVRFEAL